MLHLNGKQMEALAATRRTRLEVAMVTAKVREHARPGTLPPDRVLANEVRATLHRSDELGLSSDADRLTLCLWELTLFPGLRDLPELAQMLDASSGEPNARLTGLFITAPPRIWATLMARGHQVRRDRGWA